jgi:hypothetical protein
MVLTPEHIQHALSDRETTDDIDTGDENSECR